MTQVLLVDRNDCPIGVGEKLAVHQAGLLHRAFSIFIYRERQQRIEILMQQRHPKKYHSGGLWTNTCCSHPLPNENIQDAAIRRLQEELGFTADLKEIGVFHYTASVGNQLIENEIDHVFVGKMSNQPIQFDPEEIADIQWIEINQLHEATRGNPEIYTAWLSEALQILLNYFV